MAVNFVIPQRDDDLLVYSNTSYFVSELINDQDEIQTALLEFKRQVKKGEFEQLADYFDSLFAIARSNEEISYELRTQLFNILISALLSFIPVLKAHLSDVANIDQQQASADDGILDNVLLLELNAKYGDLLLMYLYLLSRVSCHMENYVIKKMRSITATGQRRRAAAEQINEDTFCEFWAGHEGRMRLINLVYNLVSLSVISDNGTIDAALKMLWSTHSSVENMTDCIIGTMAKFLENTDTCKASGRPVLFHVFDVLRVLCVKWTLNKAVAQSLMDLALHLDFFQNSSVTTFPFVDAILQAEVDKDLDPLLSAMIAYGSKLDVELFTKGEASTRAFCNFVTTLADKYPKLMYKNLAYIVPLLYSDPHLLRSSILTVYAEVLSKCLARDDLDEKQITQRNTMLQYLQDHIVDSNALVRTKALVLWANLAKDRAIPVEQFRLKLVSDVGNRLNDNSVMVRKAAATLLTNLLEFNLFGPNISCDSISEHLVDLKQTYNRLMNNNPEFDIIRNASRTYKTIEPSIQKILKSCIHQLLSNNHEIMQRIQRYNRFVPIVEDGVEANGAEPELNQTDKYRIAELILKENTRVDGCTEFFCKQMHKEFELFRDEGSKREAFGKICRGIREIIMQHEVATSVGMDDALLLVIEERQNDYEEEAANLEREIARTMDALLFATEIEKCLKTAVNSVRCVLNPNELEELKSLVCRCNKFNVNGATAGIKRVFKLIWRKDIALTSLVIQAACEAFFSDSEDVQIRGRKTAELLLTVMRNANEEELASLEETLVQLISRQSIDQIAIDQFWRISEFGEMDNRLAAIRLLGIVARAEKLRIRPEFDRLFRIYRTKTEAIRVEVLKVIGHLSAINGSTEGITELSFRFPTTEPLLRLIFTFLIREFNVECARQWQPHCRQAVNVIYGICVRPYRFFSMLFSRLTKIARRQLTHFRECLRIFAEANKQFEWLKKQDADPMSSEVETTLVAEPEQPLPSTMDPMEVDDFCEGTSTATSSTNGPVITIKSDPTLINDGDNFGESRQIVAARERLEVIYHATIQAKHIWDLCAERYLYFVGEIALKFLPYLDVTFTRQIKSVLQTLHEITLQQEANANEAIIVAGKELNVLRFDIEQDTPLLQLEKDCLRQRGFFEKTDREDERIGLTAISEEEKLQIKLQRVLDKDTFYRGTIIGRTLPFVLTILKTDVESLDTRNISIVNAKLQEAAILCLAKFMLVNRKCCKKFLPLFFNFYDGSSVCLRNNMLIMMTDLCFRFPNVFNKFNNEFIKKIRDKNSGVRYTCLLLVAHMLLNDLIKVSGRIADIAPCLFDECSHISLLARNFFCELSRKHNILYNMMPDVVSKLTTNKDLTPIKFQEAMGFLLAFITKDQQRETLIDKLCQRFQLLKRYYENGCTNIPEALSYCVIQLQSNERCFRRLADNLRFYQEFLHIHQVYKHFCEGIAALKKKFAKSPELKASVEEFEKNIQTAHQKALRQHGMEQRLIKSRKRGQHRKPKQEDITDEQLTKQSNSRHIVLSSDDESGNETTSGESEIQMVSSDDDT